MNLSIIYHLDKPNSSCSLDPVYVCQRQLQNICKTKNKEEVAKLLKYNRVSLNLNMKFWYFHVLQSWMYIGYETNRCAWYALIGLPLLKNSLLTHSSCRRKHVIRFIFKVSFRLSFSHRWTKIAEFVSAITVICIQPLLRCNLFLFLFSLFLQLFDLVYREETLLNVIKSVTRNGRSIILTAVLALILVYLFSIIGFLFLKDDFTMEVDRLKNRTPATGTALATKWAFSDGR